VVFPLYACPCGPKLRIKLPINNRNGIQMKIKSQHFRFATLGVGVTLILLGGIEWKFGQVIKENLKNTIVSCLFLAGAVLFFYGRELDKRERQNKQGDDNKNK
jgi:hypothetical protein